MIVKTILQMWKPSHDLPKATSVRGQPRTPNENLCVTPSDVETQEPPHIQKTALIT